VKSAGGVEFSDRTVLLERVSNDVIAAKTLVNCEVQFALNQINLNNIHILKFKTS
jgi:hypothetical protein